MDIVDSKTRSRIMASTRGKNTKPDLVLRKALRTRPMQETRLRRGPSDAAARTPNRRTARGNRLTTGVSQQDPYNGKGNDSDKSAANRRIHAVLCSRRHLVVQLPRCRSHGSAGNSRAGCRFGMFGQMPGFNATPWRPAPKAASPDELAVDCLVQLQKGIEHRAMLQGLTVGTRCLLRDRASIALAAVRRPDPSRGELKVCSMKNRIAGRQGERVRAVATIEVMQGPFQRGNDDDPVRNSSTARAHCRPSRMAQTTSD